MKNVILGLLCAALVACVIWGGSLSSENQGLVKEKADMERRYAVLQLLYQQGQEELSDVQARSAADRLALEAQARHWREALMKTQGDALPETAEEPLPQAPAQREEAPVLLLLDPAEEEKPAHAPESEEPALPLAPPDGESAPASAPDAQEAGDPAVENAQEDHEEIPVG